MRQKKKGKKTNQRGGGGGRRRGGEEGKLKREKEKGRCGEAGMVEVLMEMEGGGPFCRLCAPHSHRRFLPLGPALPPLKNTGSTS